MRTWKYPLNLLAPKSLVTLSSLGKVLKMKVRVEREVGILFTDTYICDKRIKICLGMINTKIQESSCLWQRE